MAIISVVLAVIFVLAIAFLWGFLVTLAFPKRLSAVGDKVFIFLDGVYNREATITGIGQEKVVIYETLPLPLAYRGKFYGVGCDRDGVEMWYLADRRLYWLVPYAERIRKRYKIIDCAFNFPPVEEPLPVEVVEAAAQEGDGVEPEETNDNSAKEGSDHDS